MSKSLMQRNFFVSDFDFISNWRPAKTVFKEACSLEIICVLLDGDVSFNQIEMSNCQTFMDSNSWLNDNLMKK